MKDMALLERERVGSTQVAAQASVQLPTVAALEMFVFVCWVGGVGDSCFLFFVYGGFGFSRVVIFHNQQFSLKHPSLRLCSSTEGQTGMP